MAGARCMKAKQTYEAACYVIFAYTLHLNLLSYPRLLEGDASLTLTIDNPGKSGSCVLNYSLHLLFNSISSYQPIFLKRRLAIRCLYWQQRAIWCNKLSA